jgi:uncharacterized protein (UPF0335 family)
MPPLRASPTFGHSSKKTGRPPKYTQAQVLEGIEIVQSSGEVPNGDSVKKAMCTHLGVPGGINAQSLDKEVLRLVEERNRQHRDQLVAALPSAALGAAKKIGSLVEAALIDHLGEQHHELRAVAAKNAASLCIDLGNQREQIRELLSRIERRDEEIAELEAAKEELQERLEAAAAEVRALKERVSVYEKQEDFETRVLARMEERLLLQAKGR